ncbi:MAG: hypothetical protein V1835_01125 [Candidatus Micrarchaeota archaeon]
MEHFILNRAHYHKLISEEDEFYYPLIFQTSLLNARYVGKTATMQIKGKEGEVEGVLLGVLGESLLSYFRKFLSSPDLLNASSLPFDETEHEWLETHLKTKPFPGIKYVSRPKGPPYYILLSEHGEFIIFTSISESELEDLPKINYNKIIMNESIEQLVSYVKGSLPKKLREKKKSPKTEPSLETKLKQLRISKFLKAAEEGAERPISTF